MQGFFYCTKMIKKTVKLPKLPKSKKRFVKTIFKVKEDPINGKQVLKDTFVPFAWVGDLRPYNFYSNSKFFAICCLILITIMCVGIIIS